MKKAPGRRAAPASRRSNYEQRKAYFTARWARLRAKVLSRDRHLCRACLEEGRTEAGNQVDHIEPADENPDLFWRADNLQTLCRVCHGRKTRTEDGKR